jgi:Rha family phage regulatory protein
MQLVITYQEKVTTTSLLVAQKFGKEHKNVLRDIENLKCKPEFRRLNFELSNYENRGKQYPVYIMTREGFTLLVMGFTGVAAVKFKIEFLEEFKRMEALLKVDTTPKPLLQVYSKRIINDEARNCPETHWCIFTESHPVMIAVESNVGSQCEFDLIDGSIGIAWAKFRKGKSWAGDASTYPYEFSDKRGSREAKCYLNSELEHFRRWLKNVYKPDHLPDYLRSKYAGNHFMMKRVETFIPKLLNNRRA